MADLSRRHILEAAIALGLTAVLPWHGTVLAGEAPEGLAAALDSRGLQQLAQAAKKSLNLTDMAALNADLFPTGDPETDLSGIRRRVRSDFAANRVLSLRHWGFAETEAKLICLLAA